MHLSYKSIFFILFFSIGIAAFAQPAAEVLQYVTNCRLEEGKLTITQIVQLQVNGRAGDAYATVSIPFNKRDKVTDIEATLEDSRGNVLRKLKKADIIEASAISNAALYEDDYVKVFTLKHNSYPYQIRYSYSITRPEFIHIAYWYPSISGLPSRSARLSLEAPSDYKFNLESHLIDAYSVEEKEATIKHTWSSAFDQNLKNELFAPEWEEVLPHVSIAPRAFTYGLPGKLDDWTSFGDWLYRLNGGLRNLPEEEKSIISNIIRDTDDKREKVKRLYHYLQDHTRYILVSIELGGLKAYPAEYVARNKYGDCKALSNYMKAMLDFAGIPSFYTVIKAGRLSSPINKDFPSQQFNHVVVTVPMEQDTIWLECTSSDVPFGYVGSFIQNRDALVIDGNESRFIRTPALKPANVAELARVEVTVEDENRAAARASYALRGVDFEKFSYRMANFTKAEQQQVIREYIPLSNFELQGWDISKPHRDSTIVHLNVELTSSDFIKKYGDVYVFTGFPITLHEFESPKKRSLPARIPYPIVKELSLTVTFPENWKVDHLPQSVTHSGVAGSYSVDVQKADNGISISKKYALHPEYYELEDYNDLYSFINHVKASETSNLLVMKKTVP